MKIYEDHEIVKTRRSYPLQITKLLPDLDYIRDDLESELERLTTGKENQL